MDDAILSSSCDLGRKEYWENFYSKELENFEEYGDEGDIWFGKKNVDRIVDWLLRNNIDKSSSILDIGCGNGITLVSLGRKGFTDLTGIDYAKEAIELAKHIAQNNNIAIKFQVLDFLTTHGENTDSEDLKKEFHVIIDKGTYDAISLCPDEPEIKRKNYVNRIKQLLNASGYFIIFSCNWTKEELLCQFVGLSVHDEIEIPKIGFGGKTGQTVTAVIFKKLAQTNT